MSKKRMKRTKKAGNKSTAVLNTQSITRTVADSPAPARIATELDGNAYVPSFSLPDKSRWEANSQFEDVVTAMFVSKMTNRSPSSARKVAQECVSAALGLLRVLRESQDEDGNYVTDKEQGQ